MQAPLPPNEAERLEALRQYDILDTAPEQEFDDLAHLAAQICGTPISAITLVDGDRQWFKSRVGIEVAETPRAISFCAHAILGSELLVIPDASQDERFADNPLVTGEPHLRFYASVPLVTPEGHALGTLCVLDTVPRQLDPTQQEALLRLGRQSVALLEARPDSKTLQRQSRQERRQAEQQRLSLAAEAAQRDIDNLKFSEMRYRRLFESAKDGILILDAASGKIEDVNPYLCRLLGYERDDFLGKQLWAIGTFRDIAANQDAFRTLQEKEYIRYEDLPLQTKNGQIVSVEFISNVYASGDKNVIQCNIRDISERKRAAMIEQESHRFLQSVLDALASHIAVLEEDGQIIAVNQAWRQFSEENQGTAASCGVGANYLEVCDGASGAWAEEAPVLAQGIRDVIAGQSQAFCLEYPCHSPNEERWFNVCVTRFIGEGPVRVVVAHENITERKRAEESLRAGEERFQSIVANVPGTVYQFVLNPDGSVEIPFVNEGCRELFEVAPEEIRRHPTFPMEVIHPDDQLESNRLMADSATTLRPWSWEGRIKLPSGKIKWVQGAAQPRRLPNGGTLWDGLLIDISARKEAEDERDRFFTMALDMLGIAGMNGYFKRVNPAFSETLGYTEAELLAKPFMEFVHPEDLATTQAAVEKLSMGSLIVGFENRYRCKDGSWRWLEWKSVAAVEEGAIYAAARDITERKQAETALHKANDELELHVVERTAELEISNRELRHNEARLIHGNTIFTELTRLHVSTDDELRAALSQINEAGCTLLNIDRCSIWLYTENSTAIRCFDLYERVSQSHTQGMELSVEDYPDYFRALTARQTILADEAHTHPATHEFSAAYLTPLGITSMLDAPIVIGGEMVGVVCCEHIGERRRWQIEDQTFAGSAASLCSLALESYERTRAEVALRQAKEEAEAARREADSANLAKSEFLSRMSHELRTPLNAILGFGQILETQNLTPLSTESVDYILKGGRHLLDLINEVLDIARVEAGHLELSLEPIDLSDVVPEACALVRLLAAERDIHIHFDQDTAELGRNHILADRQRLKQVLINLLANAIKYNHAGGQVEVSCRHKSDGWTSISVRDTGPGIAPQDLPKLFTPFERLNASTSEIEGTGLGLVLSQRLVSAMGGTLSVQSTLGQGSIFTIELPQAISPQEQLAHLPKDALHADRRPKVERTYSVLCIEDNLSNLRLLEVIFQGRPEIILLAAMQGSVGLDLARQHEPDLILLDLNLPDINGKDVLARLQQSAITRDIPVVVISADATPNQVQRVLDAGAKAYLTKPLDVPQFLQTLERFLQVTPALLTPEKSTPDQATFS